MTQESGKPTFRAKRIIALDYGLARIGIALSDEQKLIASPLMTFSTLKKSEDTVAKIIEELKKHAELNRYNIEEVVIGLPLLMNGKKGLFADEVLHFIEVWKKHCDLPILTWDERLSSVQADRSLRESNLSRKKRSKVVDVVAATIILQSYLDHKRIMQNTM